MSVISLTVEASDNRTEVTTSFKLTLTNARPIVYDGLEAQSVKAGKSFNYTFLSTAFTDTDDILTYTSTLNDGSPLPAWLSFSAGNRTFFGTPSSSDLGVIFVEVKASDGQFSAEDDFELAITNARPKVLEGLEAQSIKAGKVLNYTFSATAFTDADDPLVYTAMLVGGRPLPSWLSFHAGNRTFSGIPQGSDLGASVIEVTASDGQFTAEDSFDITVTNARPAVFDGVIPQSVKAGKAFSYQFSATAFTDADDILTYIATLLDGSVLPCWLSFNPLTRTFSGTPTGDDLGSTSVKVVASDGQFSVSSAFPLTVTNAKPEVRDGFFAQSIKAGKAFSYQFTETAFRDADDALTYTATLSNGLALPSWLTFNAEARTFSGTPAGDDLGTLSVKVTASDSQFSASSTFALSVTNAKPEVKSGVVAQSIKAGTAFSYQFSETAFTDADDSLVYTATLSDGTSLPSWLSFNAETRTFSGTPTDDDLGTLSVKVIASDGQFSASSSFALAVTNARVEVNKGLLSQTIAVANGLSYQFATDSFKDVDDVLTYTAQLKDGSALPAWLKFDSATRTFSGTPTRDDLGGLAVKVTATDGQFSASSAFDLLIEPSLTVDQLNYVVNFIEDTTKDLPDIIISTPASSVTVEMSLSTADAGVLTTPSSGSVTATYNSARGVWSVTGSPTDVQAILTQLQFVPSEHYDSNFNIEYSVADGINLPLSGKLTMLATPTPDPLAAGTPITVSPITKGQELQVLIPASAFDNPDGDLLTLSADLSDGSPLPTWLSFNPTTRLLSKAASMGKGGRYDIRITATSQSDSTKTTSIIFPIERYFVCKNQLQYLEKPLKF